MRVPPNLNWALSPQEAAAQQRVLAVRVREQNDFPDVKRVAGVDVGFEENNTITRAAVVILSFPELRLVDSVIARRPVTFPYVPGLLAYRELPAVLAAFQELNTEPDLIIVDGQGRAHPRRFGIACHLGVLLDRATIGCAKSILVGRAEPVENRVGVWQPLQDKSEIVGAAVRTRLNVAPVYVSIGHKIDLPTAVDWVIKCTKGYRVPETTRFAHNAASGKLPGRGGEQGTLF